MNGARASRARRRAISVLPTPVAPIMRMFFGVISLLSGSGTCTRRQRFLSAMATARLALSWPTMCLSSSWTISLGVIDMSLRPGFGVAGEFLDGDETVGVDADVAGDLERLLDDLPRAEVGVLQEGAGGRLCVGAAGADGHEVELGLDHVAVARDDQRGVLVGDAQQRLEPAQHAVGAPVLGQFDRGAGEIAVLLQLALEVL